MWLNLMMAAILNSTMLDSDTAILDSDTFLFSLKFTQKHSPSTLNQTNSIWLTWWWLPSWILPSWIQPFCTKSQILIQLINLMMAPIILPSWIQPFCTKLWLKFYSIWLNSFILTQLDDGSHLEFCHVGFRLLDFFSQIHSKTFSLHSDSDSN